MSKLRALVVSTLLATALVGGAVSTGGASQAQAPTSKSGPQWCC